MTNASLPKISMLPVPFRMGIAFLVITLLGGYIVSGMHLRWHYDNRDEEPGLTINDFIGAYHGVQSPSPLISSLESGHPETLGEPDRSALLDWLRGDRLSQDYDNLDLGEQAPSEIIAFQCIQCHARSASGEGAAASVPLEYWDDVQSIAFSKDIQPAGTKIVAMSQHAHAPTMAIVLLVLSILAACCRSPIRLVGLVVFLGGLGLMVDMSGWWIARSYASFSYAIVAGGMVYALASGVLGLLILVECFMPSQKPS